MISSLLNEINGLVAQPEPEVFEHSGNTFHLICCMIQVVIGHNLRGICNRRFFCVVAAVVVIGHNLRGICSQLRESIRL